MFVEGREDLFGGLGSAFQVAIHSRTSFSSATTLLVNAAFEQLIDVASRRLKLRRLHPQLRNQLLALFFGIVRH